MSAVPSVINALAYSFAEVITTVKSVVIQTLGSTKAVRFGLFYSSKKKHGARLKIFLLRKL